MNTSAIRQQLHQYIDSADDNKIEAIFTILQAEINQNPAFTDAELKMFYERRQNYMAGDTKTYSAEEAHEYIRRNRKK